MPIYDFECADCGPFVVMRRIADRDAACHCPDCGNEGTRVVTAPSLALMGSASRAAHATLLSSLPSPQYARKMKRLVCLLLQPTMKWLCSRAGQNKSPARSRPGYLSAYFVP